MKHQDPITLNTIQDGLDVFLDRSRQFLAELVDFKFGGLLLQFFGHREVTFLQTRYQVINFG
jgi:hypothetical protein